MLFDRILAKMENSPKIIHFDLTLRYAADSTGKIYQKISERIALKIINESNAEFPSIIFSSLVWIIDSPKNKQNCAEDFKSFCCVAFTHLHISSPFDLVVYSVCTVFMWLGPHCIASSSRSSRSFFGFVSARWQFHKRISDTYDFYGRCV